MNIIWFIVILAPIFAFIAITRNQRAISAERSATVRLEVDDIGARRELADGRTEEIAWDEVVEVDLFTTRKGPHRDAGGAIVLYGTAERGCIVPLDRIEDSGILVQLGRLEAFDLSVVIGALDPDAARTRDITSTNSSSSLSAVAKKPSHATTVCWVRPGFEGFGQAGIDPEASG